MIMPFSETTILALQKKKKINKQINKIKFTINAQPNIFSHSTRYPEIKNLKNKYSNPRLWLS